MVRIRLHSAVQAQVVVNGDERDAPRLILLIFWCFVCKDWTGLERLQLQRTILGL